jgi:hypothetical protein
MGCELSRQLREPCWGASMVMGLVVDAGDGLRHAACLEAAAIGQRS